MNLNKFLLLPLFSIMFLNVSAVQAFQAKVYVCPPCGHPHTETFDKPGTCQQCSMELILKSPNDLNNEEICDKIENNPDILFVDVRTEMEFNGRLGHFKNAMLIPINEFETRFKELNDYKDKEIIIYCSAAIRSTRAHRILEKNGYKKVYNLVGGLGNLSPEGKKCLSKYIVIEK